MIKPKNKHLLEVTLVSVIKALDYIVDGLSISGRSCYFVCLCECWFHSEFLAWWPLEKILYPAV